MSHFLTFSPTAAGLAERGVKLVTIWCLSTRFFLVRFLTVHLLRKSQLRWEKKLQGPPLFTFWRILKKSTIAHTKHYGKMDTCLPLWNVQGKVEQKYKDVAADKSKLCTFQRGGEKIRFPTNFLIICLIYHSNHCHAYERQNIIRTSQVA